MSSFAPTNALFDSFITDGFQPSAGLADASSSSSEDVYFGRPGNYTGLVIFEPLPKPDETKSPQTDIKGSSNDAKTKPGGSAKAQPEGSAKAHSSNEQYQKRQCRPRREQHDPERRFDDVTYNKSLPDPITAPTGPLCIGQYPAPANAVYLSDAPRDGFANRRERQEAELIHQRAQEAGEAAQAPSNGRKPVSSKVTVRIYHAGVNDVFSHIDIRLEMEWQSDEEPPVAVKSSALLRLHASQIVPGSDRIARLQDVQPLPDALRQLPAGYIKHGEGITYTCLDYRPGFETVWATNLLGRSNFGPHAPTVEQLGSFAVLGARIHIVTANSGMLSSRGTDFVFAPLGRERASDPLNDFWQGDRAHIQYQPGEVKPLNTRIEKATFVPPSFRDLFHFVTASMVPLVRDREYHHKLSTVVYREQRARFVSIPHHPHHLLMIIEVDETNPLLLPEDQPISVRIHCLNAGNLRTNDWIGFSIPEPSCTRATDRAFRIRRPFDKTTNSFRGKSPSRLKDAIRMARLTDVPTAQALLDHSLPHAVDIRVAVDSKSFQRREQTILAAQELICREQRADPLGVSVTGDILLGNRFNRLPPLDLLHSLSPEQVSNLQGRLHASQHTTLHSFREMLGGFALVDGCAGAGKSTVVLLTLVALAQAMPPVQAATSSPPPRQGLRALVTSPLNANADENARVLREEFHKLGMVDAIVIREYNQTTTKALLTDHIADKNTSAFRARQYDEQAALQELHDELDFNSESEAFQTLRVFGQHEHRRFAGDKRVTATGRGYSIAAYAIRAAKLESPSSSSSSPISDAELARIRACVPADHLRILHDTYGTYRQARGHVTPEEKTALSEAFRTIREDILNIADVVSTTCQLASDPSLWLLYRARIFILDEAYKALFAESLCFTWYPSCPFRILVGDSMQAHPQNYIPVKKNPWAPHMLFSLAGRLRLGGFPTTQQMTQYRYIEEIATHISPIFYDNRLKTGTIIDQVKFGETQKAFIATIKSFSKQSCASPIILLSVRNTASHRTAVTQSVFNPATAQACWGLIDRMQKKGIPSDHIGIISPYVAQRTLHERVRSTRATRILSSNSHNIMIETSERAQGLQRPILLFDVPNTRHLGSATHATKLCTGITRCQLGLILVCDVEQLEFVRGFTTSPIGRLVDSLQSAGLSIGQDADKMEKWRPDWFQVPDMTKRSQKPELQDVVEDVDGEAAEPDTDPDGSHPDINCAPLWEPGD